MDRASSRFTTYGSSNRVHPLKHGCASIAPSLIYLTTNVTETMQTRREGHGVNVNVNVA